MKAMKNKFTVQRGFHALITASLLTATLLLTACSADEIGQGSTYDADGRLQLLLSAQMDNTAATTRSSGSEAYESALFTTEGSNTVFRTGHPVDLFIFEEAQTGNRDIQYDGAIHYLQSTAPSNGTTDASKGHGNFLFYTDQARTTETKYYWPANGNRLSFYAYSPAGFMADKNVTKITSANSTVSGSDATTIDVTIPLNQSATDAEAQPSKAHDVLFGIPTHRSIESGDAATNPVARPDKNDTGKEINLNFTHRLSKVVIKITGDGKTLGNGITGPIRKYAEDHTASGNFGTDGVITNGFNAESKDMFTGALLTLGDDDIYNSYTLTLNTGVATVKNGSSDSKGTYTLKAVASPKAADVAYPASGAPTYYYQSYWCIIPPGQQISGKKLRLRLSDASEASTYEVALPQIGGSANTATAGNCYEYTVTVGLRDILITGQITNWTTETLDNVHADNTALNQPLTITSQADDNTVKFSNKAANSVNWIHYNAAGVQLATGSVANGENSGPTLANGDYVTFTADNTAYGTSDEAVNSKISCTQNTTVSGNIMSLISSTGYPTATALTGDYAFSGLFQSNKKITDASKLLLPATTLAQRCYSRMFQYCEELLTAPALPATQLADWCYFRMFNQCKKLTAAPELPATTVPAHAYRGMFGECSALTTVPELPATSLGYHSYYWMFQGCSSLTTAPTLPATTLAEGCYRRMFYKCSNLQKAPELPAKVLAKGCYMSMFKDCTSLQKAPDLPATSLLLRCYNEMFAGCSALRGNIKLGVTDANASTVTYGTTVDEYGDLNDGSVSNMFLNAGTASGTVSEVMCTSAKVAALINMNAETRAISPLATAGCRATPLDYRYLPLTVHMDADGALSIANGSSKTYQYRTRTSDGAWGSWSTSIPTVSGKDSEVQIIGPNAGQGESQNLVIRSSEANHHSFGNIMSLQNNTEPITDGAIQTLYDDVDITGSYAFMNLFNVDSKLTDAEHLMMPATTLNESCYRDMFSFCTALETAPDLPATMLALKCYRQTFKGCSKLKTLRIAASSGQITDVNCEDMMNGAGSSNGNTGKIYGYSGIVTDLKNNAALTATYWTYGGAY